MNLSEYTSAQLVTAFNAITGQNVARFSDRKTAERRVCKAVEENNADLAAILGLKAMGDAIAEASDKTPSAVEPEPQEPAGLDAPSGDEAPFRPRSSLMALIESNPDLGQHVESYAADTAPAKPEKPAKTKEANGMPRDGSKKAVILSMVMRPEGATEDQMCEAIGWKACLVTLRRTAAAAGVTLRTEKAKGGRATYFGAR